MLIDFANPVGGEAAKEQNRGKILTRVLKNFAKRTTLLNNNTMDRPIVGWRLESCKGARDMIRLYNVIEFHHSQRWTMNLLQHMTVLHFFLPSIHTLVSADHWLLLSSFSSIREPHCHTCGIYEMPVNGTAVLRKCTYTSVETTKSHRRNYYSTQVDTATHSLPV